MFASSSLRCPTPPLLWPCCGDVIPRRALSSSPVSSRTRGDELLDLWLKADSRTLQPSQRREIHAALLAVTDSALAEARRGRGPAVARLRSSPWARRDRAAHDPKALGPSFTACGSRREPGQPQSRPDQSGEGRPDRKRIARCALARQGLLRRVPRAGEVPPSGTPPAIRCVVAAFFDLEPYLTERHADGAPLMAFFHRQFGEVVERTFLGPADATERHASLARYFAAQPNQFGQGGRAVFNSRKVRRVAVPTAPGAMWAQLARTLTDLAFIEAKCAAGLTYDLIGDYDAALRSPSLPRRYRHRSISSRASFARMQTCSSLLPSSPFSRRSTSPTPLRPRNPLVDVSAPVASAGPGFDGLTNLQSPSPCLFTMVGHRDIVNSCDVSRDGRLISRRLPTGN